MYTILKYLSAVALRCHRRNENSSPILEKPTTRRYQLWSRNRGNLLVVGGAVK